MAMSDNNVLATDSLMEELCKEFQARLGPLPVARIVDHPYPHQPHQNCSVLLTRTSYQNRQHNETASSMCRSR
jgi:hypothetical protein